jgi:hypothetical protein
VSLSSLDQCNHHHNLSCHIILPFNPPASWKSSSLWVSIVESTTGCRCHRMKFRPLCIDYQGEALYFEEEKSRQAGKKRSVIWIQNPSFSNTREINHSKTKNASACRPTRTGLVPRSASIVQTTSTSTTVLTDQRHTNDDQISATVSPTPIKDDREKSNGKYRAKGEECFVAVFKPPRAFLDWMGNNSVSVK